MKKTITAALLSLLILSNGWGQDVTIAPAGNWNKVQDLPAKTNVIVELKHAGSVEGEFVRLTGDALVVKEFERERTFPTDSVAAVRQMRPGSRAKKAAIAGGILFGIGFGLGYAAAPKVADQDDLPSGERVAAAAAIGGIFGGAAAALSLLHRPGTRSEVIYRAK